MDSKDYKKIIIDGLSACLKPFGFKRKDNSYQKSNGDITYYITLQSSMSSTSQLLKLTLNIEMASAMLAAFDDDRLPIHLHRHYHKRIGNYLDVQQDKWFLIDSVESAQRSSQEITQIIRDKILPKLESFKSASDLMSKPGGLTNVQIAHYSKILNEQTGLS